MFYSLDSYILNRGWIDKSSRRLPTYKEITTSSSKKGKEIVDPDEEEDEEEGDEEGDNDQNDLAEEDVGEFCSRRIAGKLG